MPPQLSGWAHISSKVNQQFGLLLSEAELLSFPVVCSIQDQTSNILIQCGTRYSDGFSGERKKYKMEAFAIAEHTK